MWRPLLSEVINRKGTSCVNYEFVSFLRYLQHDEFDKKCSFRSSSRSSLYTCNCAPTSARSSCMAQTADNVMDAEAEKDWRARRATRNHT